MLIRRLSVRDFRRIGAIELRDLGPGATVIAGDNEAGKSTLLDALRAAFFERHGVGGQVLEAMMPYGSVVRPEIEVEFEIDGAPHALRKRFGKGAEASLTTPAGRFEGPEADERLGALMQFEPATGRASAEARRAGRGVQGLFWLEQGHVHHGLGLGGPAQATLRGALEDEVGDVLGGARGKRLLRAARERRGALLTATGKETGRLKAAREEAEAARAEAARTAAELAEYDADIDALAALREDLAALEEGGALAGLEARAAEAQAQAEALSALDAEAERAARAAELAAAQAETARGRAEARAQAAREAEGAEAAAARAAGAAGAAAAEAQAAEATRGRAREARRAAEAAAAAARARLEAAERAERRRELARRAEAAEARLAQARGFREARARARATLAGATVDARTLEAVRRLEAGRREAEVRAEAAATRITPLPDGAAGARLGERRLPPGEAVRLDGPAEIALEGWGRLRVEPGAGDFDAARAAAEAAAARLAEALRGAGCATLAEAEAAASARAAAESEAREAERSLAIVAPEGAEALEAEAEALRAALAGLGEAEVETAEPAALRTAAEDAEAEAGRARARAEAADAAAQAASEARVGAEAARAAADAARETAAARLAEARAARDDREVERAASEAEAALEAARAARTAAEARLAAAEPERVRLELARLRAAAAEGARRRDDLRGRAARLEAVLERAGGAGLGERAEAARAGAEAAETRADALAAEARALDLLTRTLEEAEARAREAFLAPILERVEPYLRLVMPGARLRLTDDLEIAEVERDGRAEPFAGLSVGAREQVSVLVRLAFAAYLREKGRPAMVMLDDSLVYADAARFERMKDALWRAAEGLQVLILTCRPDDWLTLGAPVRRLPAGGGASGA